MNCSVKCWPLYGVTNPDLSCTCVDRKVAYAYALCRWQGNCYPGVFGSATGGSEMPNPEAIEVILNSLTPEPILARAEELLQTGEADQASELLRMITDLAPVDRANQRMWLSAAYTLEQKVFAQLEQTDNALTAGALVKVADAFKENEVQPQLLSEALMSAVSEIGPRAKPAQLRFIGQTFQLQADMLQEMADRQLLNPEKWNPVS